MGLFGGNEKQIKMECVQKIAHMANDAGLAIGNCLEQIEKNNEQFENFSVDVLEIKDTTFQKLDETEQKQIVEIIGHIISLKQANLDNYNLIIELGNNQQEITQQAIDDYEEAVEE